MINKVISEIFSLDAKIEYRYVLFLRESISDQLRSLDFLSLPSLAAPLCSLSCQRLLVRASGSLILQFHHLTLNSPFLLMGTAALYFPFFDSAKIKISFLNEN